MSRQEGRPRADWDTHWNVILRVRLKPFRDAVVWDMYSKLLRLIDFPPEPDILELAVGEGYQTARILKEHGGRGVGVDINPIPLELARLQAEKFGVGDRMKLVKADILRESGKIPRRPYFLVHSEGILEHFLPEEQVAIMKLHRDMSRRYVIVFTPRPSPLYWGVRAFFTWAGRWIYPDENPMTADQIAALGERVGLRVVRKEIHYWENGVLFEV